MRPIINTIGSLFFSIAVLITYLAINSFFVDDPYELSATEFEELYKDKEAYSYIYFGSQNRNIFICLDKSFSRKEDKRTPKCKGNRRYINTAELDELTKTQLMWKLTPALSQRERDLKN